EVVNVLCSGIIAHGAHLTWTGAFHGDVSPWRQRHAHRPARLAGGSGGGDVHRGAWACFSHPRWTVGAMGVGNAPGQTAGSRLWHIVAQYIIPGGAGHRLSLSPGGRPRLCQPPAPLTQCAVVRPMCGAGVRPPWFCHRRGCLAAPGMAGSYGSRVACAYPGTLWWPAPHWLG